MKALSAKSRDYGKLCDELRSLLEKGRLQAEKAVSEIANRTYWKVGKCLDAQSEVKDTKTSAAFIGRLASDLGISPSLLYHALQFFRAYPEGLPENPDAARLSWGSHLALLPLKDSEERLYYLERAINEGWSRSRLRRAIRSDLYATESGAPGGSGDAAAMLERPTSGLHTYVGVLERVIDADTLEVRVDLGFDVWKVERIRLRGIDAPELNTPEGKDARAFVEKALEGAPLVALKTYKMDRYARYIADVFYDPAAAAGGESKLFETGRFLNRDILAAGHAVVLFPFG